MLLECNKLCKYYGDKAALNNIDLQLERGKIIGLLGPNGSGKTTLIKILSGILTPSGGEVKISDKNIGIETKFISFSCAYV